MRFMVVFLSALFCLNAVAEGVNIEKATDQEIVAAAEKLVQESQEASGTQGSDESTDDAKGAVKPPVTAVTKVDAIDNDNRSESEIPLFAKSEKVTKTERSFMWRLIGSLVFISIAGGALVFAAKRWAVKKNAGGEKARIDIIHQLHMGPKRSIALIRVAGETMLIGCTDQSVNLIKSVALIDGELNDGASQDFNNFLDEEFIVADLRSNSGGRA